MRVAQILYSGLGGHGGVAFGIVDGDAERACRWSFGFLGIETVRDDYVSRCTERGIAWRYIPAVAGTPWRSWSRLLRWLDDECPDAIILHSPPALLPCALHARRRRVPLIVVEHQQNQLKRWGDWAASRVAMRMADRVVVLTEDYAAMLAKGLRGAYRPDKVNVISNGIDLNLFRPAYTKPPGPFRIGMAARFTPIKRFDLLIEAMAYLRKLRPDQRFELSLAGEGETWAAMRAAAQAAGVGDLVVFKGMLVESDLAEWFRGLHLYAHASAGETLSLSLLQAMATALPITASHVPGIDTLLDKFDCEAVRLVRDPKASSFAAAIVNIADRCAEVTASAWKLRIECESRYSSRVMADQYKALLLELRLMHQPR